MRMSRRAQQEARREERATIVSDDTIWHMTFVAVVAFFDLRDGHINDSEWTDRVYGSMDLSEVRTGITNSMRARRI